LAGGQPVGDGPGLVQAGRTAEMCPKQFRARRELLDQQAERRSTNLFVTSQFPAQTGQPSPWDRFVAGDMRRRTDRALDRLVGVLGHEPAERAGLVSITEDVQAFSLLTCVTMHSGIEGAARMGRPFSGRALRVSSSRRVGVGLRYLVQAHSPSLLQVCVRGETGRFTPDFIGGPSRTCSIPATRPQARRAAILRADVHRPFA